PTVTQKSGGGSGGSNEEDPDWWERNRARWDHFKRQLENHGKPSLLKSQRNISRELAKHYEKIAEAREKGGYTSSMEAEVRNYEAELEVIAKLLRSALLVHRDEDSLAGASDTHSMNKAIQ